MNQSYVIIVLVVIIAIFLAEELKKRFLSGNDSPRVISNVLKPQTVDDYVRTKYPNATTV